MQDLGVELDGAAEVPSAPAELALDDSGFVEFAVTGTKVSGEFGSGDCGYGAVVQRALPPCPMCGGAVC